MRFTMTGSGRLLIFALGACILFTVGLFAVGCAKPANRPGKTVVDDEVKEQADRDDVESVCLLLNKKTDSGSCRAALQQLNVFLARQPASELPTPLDDKQLAGVRDDLGLQSDELVEITSGSFTLLDAHYLEECFLLRDAARALEVNGLPPVQQAQAAFAWSVRQVRLHERGEPPVPPLYVLRRGYGSSLERSLTFLALLRQLDIDGCLVALAPEPMRFPERLLVGVCIDKKLFLFDARLGLSLPGAELNSVVTLSELRKQPGLLGQLTVDTKHPYDVAAEHLQQPTIYLTTPLSALSARMRFLENLLAVRKNNKVDLSVDQTASSARIKEAVGDPTVSMRNWHEPSDPYAPVRSLRAFLPPDEGGTDKYQPVPLRAFTGLTTADDTVIRPLYRRQIFEFQLVPWPFLPDSIRQVPWNVEMGAKPREVFMQMFIGLHAEPRDYLVRGQFDDAINALGEKREQLNNVLRRSDPELEQRLQTWIAKARTLQLQKQSRSGKGETTPQELWQEGLPMLVHVLHQSAEAPYKAHLKYALALCKQEKAIRLQARGQGTKDAECLNAWRAAADWWTDLSRNHGTAPVVAPTRVLHADALLALGEKAAAVGLLENLDGQLTPLEKTARLYLARQVKQQK